MEISLKKALYNIGYYCLCAIIIAFSIMFMVAMTRTGVAMYQQIVYYIWAILLILNVIFDIIATNNSAMKFISGLIFYALVFLCIVMWIIVYAGMSTNGLILIDNSTLFSIVIGFSVALSIASIILFWQGERLIEIKQERKTR